MGVISQTSDFGILFQYFLEIRQCLVDVAAFQAVLDAVVDVPHEDDLPDLVQCARDGVDLDQDVRAGDVLVYQLVQAGDLPGYLLQTPVEVVRIHALPHGWESDGAD